MGKTMLWAAAGLFLVETLLSQAPGERTELQRGKELTYELDMSRVAGDRAQAAKEAKEVISKRLEAHGLEGARVDVQGEDRLVIRLPRMDAEPLAQLKTRIERGGELELRLVAPDQSPALVEQYEKEWEAYLARDREWVQKNRRTPPIPERRPQPPRYRVFSEIEKVKDGAGKERFVPKSNGKRILENFHPTYDAKTQSWVPEGSVGGDHLDRPTPIIDEITGRPAIGFRFRGDDVARIGELTGNNKGRDLAIVFDEGILQIATIRDRIGSHGQLSGDFSDDDVKRMVTILRGGSLKTPAKLISEKTIEPVK